MTDKPKSLRGFAAMSVEQRTAIARKGGAGQAPEQRSFARDRALAVEAGRKGGMASRGSGRKARSDG